MKSYEEIYVDCFNITLAAKRVNLFFYSNRKEFVDLNVIQKNSLNVQSIKTNIEKDLLTKTNVAWEYADNTVTVTMTTEQVNLDEWRAIGFSLDREMVNQKL